jgi:hypothetical protein
VDRSASPDVTDEVPKQGDCARPYGWNDAHDLPRAERSNWVTGYRAIPQEREKVTNLAAKEEGGRQLVGSKRELTYSVYHHLGK